MKLLTLFLTSCAFLLPAFDSNAQNIKKLETNNGFKNYKLGARYTSVFGGKSALPDGSEKVSIGYTGEKIGDMPVNSVELYYVRDTLARIVVNLDARFSEPLLEASRGSFGPATADSSDNQATRAANRPAKSRSVYNDRFVWKGKKINLEYNYVYPQVLGDAYSRKQLQLIYSLNDFNTRLKRGVQKKYSSGDF